MAQFTYIDIDINGNSVKHFSSLSLSQSIFDHHTFRLVCPADVIDELSGTILNASRKLIGGAFTLEIQSADVMGTLQFSGVVTQVEASRYSTHSGDVIISGYSPTILLDGAAHCKTWEKKTIKSIAGEVLKHFPGNMLQPNIEPANSEILSYTVQYKETAWQFLKRLSAFYGEWLLYDGQKLSLAPPAGSIANLISGRNLESFDIALQVRPSGFEMVAYDYMKGEVYNSSPQGIIGKAGLNDLGKYTLEKSEQFYGTQPKQWHNQFVTDKKQLDDFVNTRAAMQSSNMVRFKGCTSSLQIVVGGIVNVVGKNAIMGSDEKLGDYRVISVNHYCNGLGNYSNDFVAIPASVNFPPVAAVSQPHCETQSAFVTDNNDPKGLARIRVRFHWMNKDEKSPWLRVTTPHAGGGKGMFMMPEVGEEVIVGFEGDSAVRPYIIGAVYHGKANNTYSNNNNDVKAWQSRSGNKVVMNDKDGSVHIADKGGANTTMDGAGNIITNAAVKAAVNVGAKKGEPPQSLITMDSDGNIVIDSKTSITIKVGGNVITITKEGITTTAAEGNITTDATAGKFSLHSASEMDVATDANLTITGGPKAVISSGNTNVM